MLALLASTLFLLVGTGSDGPRLSAKFWLNNPEFRLNDDRTVVLFFFDTDENQSETRRIVRRLNRLCRRDDLVVIGLSRDSQSKIEDFARRLRVRFTLGAGSDSARSFDVRTLPRVLVLDRNDRRIVRGEDLRGLEASLSPAEASNLTNPIGTVASMEAVLESEGDAEARESSIWMLWKSANPAEYDEIVRFAAEAVDLEPDPWTRGKLAYMRDVASGQPRTDECPAPSIEAYNAYAAAPANPMWSDAHRFVNTAASLAPAQLADAYDSHSTDAPGDLVVRRMIIEALEKSSDRQGARLVLMQIVAREPDSSLRLRTTGAIGTICAPGDDDAANLLESLAASEPHILRVRPVMEYTYQMLRTGNTERDEMEPISYVP